MTTTRRLRLAALVAAPLLALTACSGGVDSSDVQSDTGGTTTLTDSVTDSDGGSTASESASDSEQDSPAPANGSKSRPAPMTRAVISTGTVSLRADDVTEARRDVQRIADAHRAQVSEEETGTDEDGRAAYARMVLRVPVAQFDATLDELEKAADLRDSSRTTEDVTTQVIDTDVRVRAQEASLRRVEALLARAEKLQDIVWIEAQLTTRQAELDSLRQQQAWLADQTSMSTITVDITLAGKAEPKKDDDGFLAGLRSGWDGLSATATALATVTGALLPFAVVLGVLGVPVWLVVRGRRRRRGAVPAA